MKQLITEAGWTAKHARIHTLQSTGGDSGGQVQELAWDGQVGDGAGWWSPAEEASGRVDSRYMDVRFEDGVYARLPRHLGGLDGEVSFELGCLRSAALATGSFQGPLAAGGGLAGLSAMPPMAVTPLAGSRGPPSSGDAADARATGGTATRSGHAQTAPPANAMQERQEALAEDPASVLARVNAMMAGAPPLSAASDPNACAPEISNPPPAAAPSVGNAGSALASSPVSHAHASGLGGLHRLLVLGDTLRGNVHTLCHEVYS